MNLPKFLNSNYFSLNLRARLQVNIFIILAFFIVPLINYAQYPDDILSNATFAEKIYLQLDSKVYTAGNTVWYKSIVTNANDHTPTTLSGVLYVELIAPDERVIEKKLTKIEKGIGQGFFYLDKSLNEGHYLIRAYTRWNKNFETDFIFKEYIRVYAAQQNEDISPINNITLIKGSNSDIQLEAILSPLRIDSLHNKKLTVFISSEGKTDTIYVKRDVDKKYKFNYTLPDTCHFATLQMETDNKHRFSETIILDNKFVDLQFFPEGGELVHGLPNKLGVKALNAHGKGMKISGTIVNDLDSSVASFSTNPLGMGSFILSHVDSSVNYWALIHSQSNDDFDRLYPLPKPVKFGNILIVNKNNTDVVLTAMSNYLVDDSIFLQMSHRGIKLYESKVGLKKGVCSMIMPNDKLPEGIIRFTMLDKLKQPIAERLFFNEKPDEKINISLNLDKSSYQRREATRLKIKTTNSGGEAVNTNLSVLVINNKQLGKLHDTKQNILSYFLLDSELKGEIESPAYYFNKDSSMHHDLDALMLTQGWRKYHYRKPFKEITFQPEAFLSVSGQVGGLFSDKRRKRAKLTLLTFGKNRKVYTQAADSLGRFNFNLGNDEYGQNLNILLQSAKRTGKKMNYTITLDKEISPPVNFNHIKTVEKPDSIIYAFIEKDVQRNKINDAFQVSSDHIAIEEVTVTGYKLTPNRKKVMEKYGKPDEVIEGKDILEKEKKWSYGLYSVLLFNYPDKVIIKRHPRGYLYAWVLGADKTVTIIDGVPVKPVEFPLIPNIPPSEVSSFEIIDCASNFYPLHHEVYGYYPRRLLCGAIISIYTHGQKGLYGANKPTGLMKTAVPVFSAPREFYSPKYKDLKPDDWKKPDLRALVHWEPELKTDSTGKTSLTFYNGDNVGKMKVIIEAISEDGKIAYQEISYEVNGEDKELIIVE